MANHRYSNANTYVADTDTVLADTGANTVIFKDLRITNTTVSNITFSMWLTDSSDTYLASILGDIVIEPGSYKLDVQAICPATGDKIVFNAPSGLEFLLTGVS